MTLILQVNKHIKNITSQTKLSEQEAWWLVESITQQSKTELLITSYELSEQEQKQLNAAIQKLNDDMPLAYVIGFVPFGELAISVKPPMLIPRPETEEWVYKLIDQLQSHADQIKTILDIGTGSGCITLALANAFPQAHVTAVDINPLALELAKQNAQQNNIANVTFIESDLFSHLKNKTFDLVVSNPPYIAPHYKAGLDSSVKNWEDHGALFAEDSGLALINNIIEQLPKHLSKQNLPTKSVIECDPEQVEPIIELCKKHGLNGHAHTDQFNKKRAVFITN